MKEINFVKVDLFYNLFCWYHGALYNIQIYLIWHNFQAEMTTTQGDGMEEKLIEMEYDSAKEKMFAIEKEHGIERLPKRVEPPEPHNCSQEEVEFFKHRK